ncbi:MAG: hypothetical protein ABIN01_09990 [Ferruginibacter sp.]
MKKLRLSVLVMFVISMHAFAQNEHNFSFSVGPELSFATGSFANTHSIGTGGTAQAEYLLIDKLKATATVGLIAYLGKSSIAGQTIIPLRVGAKYTLTRGLYGAAQLGVAFLGNYDKGTAFAYSPLMLGYEFETKSGKSIDATIKYDAYSGAGAGTIGAIGFRLAYIFN